MISADRKYRNSQLALRDQLLIVDRVLRKGRKLSAECIVNSAGSSV